MTRVFVIRHGESIANLEKFFAGQKNVQLTELGEKQAKLAASVLKDTHIDKVFSSPLDRAYYTALPFAEDRGVTVKKIPEFIERNAGEWTGKSFEEIEKLFPEEYWLWNNDSINLTISSGESSRDMIQRIGNAVDTLAKENEGLTVLVVSHAGVIKGLPYYYSENKTDELFNTTPLATNSSITEVVFENGFGKLTRYSDDSYLGDLKTGAFII